MQGVIHEKKNTKDILQHTSYSEGHPYPVGQVCQPKWKPGNKSQNNYTKVLLKKERR